MTKEDDLKQEFIQEVERIKANLREKNLTYEKLLHYAAVTEFGLIRADNYHDELKVVYDELIKNAEKLSNIRKIIGFSDGYEIYGKVLAYKATDARLAKDPRQEEKQFINECWMEWQNNKGQYKSKAEFARAMLKQVKHLTSTKKIEDWCRVWEKEHAPNR